MECEWCRDIYGDDAGGNGIESEAEDAERFCSASCEELAEGDVTELFPRW